jgi:hypothetical protein
MDKEEYTFHTMEYFLTIKSNELLIHAPIRINLEKYARWKKPDTKQYILHDSIHMKCTE